MKAENLIGALCIGPDVTVQDLMDAFNLMTPATRRASYVRLAVDDDIREIKMVSASQSDQAEAHELKVWITAEPSK
jgi:hypothetical protein